MHFGYENILELGTVTISSVATGFPGYRLFDKDVTLPWKATSTSNQTVVVDMGGGVSASINRWIITSHNLNGATLFLDYTDDDPSGTPTWTQIDTYSPSNNVVVNRSFSPSDHRAFRFRINSPSQAPEIGELYLGSTTEIAGYPVEKAQVGSVYMRTRGETQSGIPWVIEEGPTKGSFGYEFRGLTSVQKDYIVEADSDGFFFFIDHDDVLRYVESKTKVNVVRVMANWFDVTVDFLEVEAI